VLSVKKHDAAVNVIACCCVTKPQQLTIDTVSAFEILLLSIQRVVTLNTFQICGVS